MRISVSLVVLALSASPAASAAAQSLAEVAKKHEEQRKAGSTAPKVYTNDDLKAVPLPDPPASAPPAPSAGDAAAAGADSTTDTEAPTPEKPVEAKDHAYWIRRIRAAREQLDRDRVLLEAMQSRINALTMDFVNRDDPAQRAKIGSDRDRAMRELERLKTAVAGGEKAIAAIEEEARRAGAPPGWLR